MTNLFKENGKNMKVFVTGASGYVARAMLPHLFGDDEITSVRGLDIRPPSLQHPKFEYIEGDVRGDIVEKAMDGADVATHLAFIVGEIKDKKKIFDINVKGTRRVLDAVKSAGIRKLVIASSICAYGSRPDHGLITEETPLRGNRESYYSHTKMLVEQMLDEFEANNPEVVVTRLRPAILCGAMTDNFFLDLLAPVFVFYPASNPDGLPLVHDGDVGRAFHIAVKLNPGGAFNITSGNMPYSEIARIIGKMAIPLPYFMLKHIADIGYYLGIAPISSHWTALSKHRFDLSSKKAEEQLGWTPNRTPVEAFKELWAAIQEKKKKA